MSNKHRVKDLTKLIEMFENEIITKEEFEIQKLLLINSKISKERAKKVLCFFKKTWWVFVSLVIIAILSVMANNYYRHFWITVENASKLCDNQQYAQAKKKIDGFYLSNAKTKRIELAYEIGYPYQQFIEKYEFEKSPKNAFISLFTGYKKALDSKNIELDEISKKDVNKLKEQYYDALTNKLELSKNQVKKYASFTNKQIESQAKKYAELQNKNSSAIPESKKDMLVGKDEFGADKWHVVAKDNIVRISFYAKIKSELYGEPIKFYKYVSKYYPYEMQAPINEEIKKLKGYIYIDRSYKIENNSDCMIFVGEEYDFDVVKYKFYGTYGN